MTDFDKKIYELKKLLPEEGARYILEELKLWLPKDAPKLKEVIQLDLRLQELTRDKRKGILTFEEYTIERNRITNHVIAFLDELTEADFATQEERKTSRKKKNQGHLLHRIPNEMQLFKRTKCVIRLAQLREDLLEDYKMTEDTVIKSVRISEVMEVDLQDRNEDTAFEIETPNHIQQFLDEDYYTEWIFYVKPIREGQHELTLVVSVLEEVKGKERRRDVVLEEVVTIVTENPIIDEVYKPTGYVTNSTKTIEPQPFTGFMQSLRKYSAVIAFMLLGTLGTWAFGTESGQWQIAKTINTETSYERFIEKYEDRKESKLVEKARWEKAVIVNTEESFEEYLEEAEIKTFEQPALKKLETKVFERVIEDAEVTNTKPLEEYIKRFPKSTRITTVVDTLVALEYERVSENLTKENIEELVAFMKRYEQVQTKLNASFQAKAKAKYEAITDKPITPEVIAAAKVEPLKIEIPKPTKATTTTTIKTEKTLTEAEKKDLEQAEKDGLDLTAWNGAKSKNTRTAYTDYLNNYTDGKYRKEAQEKINAIEQAEKDGLDLTAWNEAKSKNTKVAYDVYLNNYPNGKYRSDATTAKNAIATIPPRTSDPFANQMVKISGGTFQMGSNESDDEKPIHSVTVSSFYMSKYEVTQKQWRDIMGTNPSHFKNCDNCPVEQVSWNDIQEFIKKLNTQTGKKYRLPTEAEWEYAAKGGQNYKYAGSDNIGSVAWYDDNSGRKTHPVGQKSANGYGLYDMSGNVWEWCQDIWHDNYSGAPTNGAAWTSGGNSAYRVLRGGSWLSPSGYCRAASRINGAPTNRYNAYGFRLVLP